MYKKVDTNLNFVQREKEVEKFWDDNNIFEKSIDSRKKGESYVFYDGPPTANGKPHIGHVLTRAIKDMIPRYRASTQILSDDPLFFLVNSYTTGLAPAVLTYMLGTELKKWNGHVDSQEIGLPVTHSGLVLPCGASGRWEAV